MKSGPAIHKIRVNIQKYFQRLSFNNIERRKLLFPFYCCIMYCIDDLDLDNKLLFFSADAAVLAAVAAFAAAAPNPPHPSHNDLIHFLLTLLQV